MIRTLVCVSRLFLSQPCDYIILYMLSNNQDFASTLFFFQEAAFSVVDSSSEFLTVIFHHLWKNDRKYYAIA